MSFQTNFTRQMVGEEGRSRYAYQDSEGFWTGGIGRLMDKRVPGSGLSTAEQDYLFVNDYTRILAEIAVGMPWVIDLDEARKAAIMNMVFQMGVGGVLGFVNSMRYVREKNWEQAAANLRQSKWARQTPERAGRVIEQIRTGIWQFKPGF